MTTAEAVSRIVENVSTVVLVLGLMFLGVCLINGWPWRKE